MGDMGDLWKDINAARKERREANYKRINPEQQLRDAGYEFEVKNYGLHLIVKTIGGQRVNFWPTTGRWCSQQNRHHHGHGFKSLLTYLNIH